MSHMNTVKKILPIFFIFLSLSSPVLAVSDYGNIISDSEMQDSKSISISTIDRFFNSHSGMLGKLTFDVVNGVEIIKKKASEIIHSAGQIYKINPKVILVTLQKEQSLIEDSTPSKGQLDWAMGYAVCDDCSKSDPAIQKYKGFVNQINSASSRIRYYFDNPNKFRHQAGNAYNIDSVPVVIKNQATANLYNYTPHIHGNKNFTKFWNAWFAINYPDGSLLQIDGQKGIWLIEDGKRRNFMNQSAFLSNYDPDKIIKITNQDLEKYDMGAPIKYSNYSLIRMPTGGIYLLVNNTKHPIASKEVFKNLGFNPEELIKGTEEDVQWYNKGEAITLEKAYPQGALLRDPATNGIWYVENGIKQPIWSKDILHSRFNTRAISKSTIEELSLYEKREPIKFRDGEIIATKDANANNRSVYVVSNGQKRPIANNEAFKALGYKWKNIIWTTDKILDLHETGEAVDVIK